jgi:hypothetical protein
MGKMADISEKRKKMLLGPYGSHISSLRPLTLEKEIRRKPVAIKSKDNHAEYG